VGSETGEQRALANGETLATDDSFAEVAKRYLDFQRRKMKAGAISSEEYVRQKGIADSHLTPFFSGLKIASIRRSKLNSYIESRTGEVSAGQSSKKPTS
jgi:hypothetical protein